MLSLALHGGLIALLVSLAREHVVHAPPPQQQPTKAVTAVEVAQPTALSLPLASPSPSPPPVQVTPATQPRSAGASAGARTRREPVQRTQPVAPAAMESLADLKISFDDTTNFARRGRTTRTDVASGPGRSGIGASIEYRRADGVVKMDIPQPATVSLARSPRPKHDYDNLRIVGASRFAGETIKLRLTIDPTGKVRVIHLLQGVDRALDRKTVALARTFEFEPALDDAGVAIQGTRDCNIYIVEDDDSDMFQTARENSRH